MTEHEKCLRCGSTRIMNNIDIIGNLEQNLGLQVHKKPQARFFKGTVGASLKARVCGSCGNTELYVPDPEKLFEAHNRASLGGELSLAQPIETATFEDRLRTLDNLLEKGLVNKSEHTTKRAAILDEV